jgi:hypothetical protein
MLQTTTGMVAAALVTWITQHSHPIDSTGDDEDLEHFDSVDGISEEKALLQGMSSEPSQSHTLDLPFLTGEYKTILKIVGVLSKGRLAKQLTDRAIDTMSAIQNLRKAIYE